MPTSTTIVLHIAGDAVTAHGTQQTVTPGAADQADLTVTADDREPFLAWITGQLTDRQAIAAGLTATSAARGLRRLRAMYPAGRYSVRSG